jgi:hypothetical protein
MMGCLMTKHNMRTQMTATYNYIQRDKKKVEREANDAKRNLLAFVITQHILAILFTTERKQ